MRSILGKDCKLYRNTGTYASPTWNEITTVKNLTLSAEFDEADVSIRGGGGFKMSEPTLLGITLEVEEIRDDDSADQTHLQLAFTTRTALDLAIAEGDMAVGTTDYFRADFKVFSRNAAEQLADAKQLSWTLKPCLSSNAPAFSTVSGTTTTTTTTSP